MNITKQQVETILRLCRHDLYDHDDCIRGNAAREIELIMEELLDSLEPVAPVAIEPGVWADEKPTPPVKGAVNMDPMVPQLVGGLLARPMTSDGLHPTSQMLRSLKSRTEAANPLLQVNMDKIRGAEYSVTVFNEVSDWPEIPDFFENKPLQGPTADAIKLSGSKMESAFKRLEQALKEQKK